MNTVLSSDILEEISRVEAHFAQAPHAFFQAWKRGVELIGPELFGKGTQEGLDQAVCKWDLRPNLLEINQAIEPMSSGQKKFLAAMVSFYNAREGGALFKRAGINGLADLAVLDLEGRQVIADLIMNYDGW